MKELIYAGIGYIAGAFTPAVGREIKSWFVKEASVVKADATKAASTEVKKL